MAHIDLGNDLPGIRGPMAFRPETAKHLNELAEVLLRDDDNTLSRGERELIGAYVSFLNNCQFCQSIHGALAEHYLQCDLSFWDSVKKNMEEADLSEKMKSLLSIAGSVQRSGKAVSPEQVSRAKSAGATDREIHDAVLIAAAFCMYNRYVDGLGTSSPSGMDFYRERAPRRAQEGYIDFDLYK